MEASRIEIKALVISLAAVLFVEAAAGTFIRSCPFNSTFFLGLVRLIEIALLVTAAVLWGKGLSSVGLARSNAAHGFARGLLWSAGFGMGALIAYLLLYAVGIDALPLIQTNLPKGPGEIALLFLVGGVVGPAAEEIFFRGFLYGFFRRWGIFVALTTSTLIFVLAHSGFPQIPITQVVGGIVLAMAYEVEGSLLAPLMIHVLGNTAIFTLSLIT
jgi:membrane protease YdiL (CAAX protease family)